MQVVAGQDYAVCPHCWAVYRVELVEGRLRPAFIGSVAKDDVIEAAKHAAAQDEPAQRSEPSRVLHRMLGIIAVVVIVLAAGVTIARFTENEPDDANMRRRVYSYCVDTYLDLGTFSVEAASSLCRDWADRNMDDNYDEIRACHEQSPALDARFADCLIDEDILPLFVTRQ
jgi:hypothetical protein